MLGRLLVLGSLEPPNTPATLMQEPATVVKPKTQESSRSSKLWFAVQVCISLLHSHSFMMLTSVEPLLPARLSLSARDTEGNKTLPRSLAVETSVTQNVDRCAQHQEETRRGPERGELPS